jgi:uncharacterized protein
VDPPPVRLRAHNLLCLQGFRGLGYSEAFVARMRAVHADLAANPERGVEVLAAPDTLCAACPHLREGCTLGGPDHEAHMRAQDEAVLSALALEAGAVVPWREILARIGARVGGADLPRLCTTCPWLPLGWCAQGIDALAARGGARGGPPTA